MSPGSSAQALFSNGKVDPTRDLPALRHIS
jgi:hypothetical protein